MITIILNRRLMYINDLAVESNYFMHQTFIGSIQYLCTS